MNNMPTVQTPPGGSSSTIETQAALGVQARWMFDYEDYFENIRARLQGKRISIDKDGKPFMIPLPEGSRLLPDEAAEAVMAFMTGFVGDRIQGLTYYQTVDEIYPHVTSFRENLSILFAVWMEQGKYNLKPTDDTMAKCRLVTRMLARAIDASMRKSLGGNGMKMVGQTERRSEVTNNQNRGASVMGIRIPGL